MTLTGYVWLFDGGDDSAGVEVQVFAENAPNTDGSLAAAAVGAYTTGAGDPIDPTDTTWNAACDNGCSYRQYAIANVPTETPLVVVTTDGGAMQWATRYEYGVVLSNADVAGGAATFDATAVQAETLVTLAQSVGLTIGEDQGLLVGEVHDCADLRLAGAVVGTDAPDTPATYYFTGTEALPTPSREQRDTTSLGLYGPSTCPRARRVSAVGQHPSTAGRPTCSAATRYRCSRRDDGARSTRTASMATLDERRRAGRRPAARRGHAGRPLRRQPRVVPAAARRRLPHERRCAPPRRVRFFFFFSPPPPPVSARSPRARSTWEPASAPSASRCCASARRGASSSWRSTRPPPRWPGATWTPTAGPSVARSCAATCAAVGLARRGQAALVVCNPPYVTPGRGRDPAAQEGARGGDVAAFVDAARQVAGRKARVCFVYLAQELIVAA